MFKCQTGYTLQTIKNICYLLPYGQQIADQKKGYRLNETGVFLWKELWRRGGAEPLQLARALLLAYGMEEASLPEVLSDVNDFLSQLCSRGMLYETLQPLDSSDCTVLQIAGLTIRLCGDNALLSADFSAFSAEETTAAADQTIDLVLWPPISRSYGQVLLQNKEMVIFANDDRYVIQFPQMDNLYEAHMTKDGSYVRIYCQPEATEENKDNLFHAIRLFFLFLAQKRGMYAIHSASVLYRDKAWLFSGHSGMGKSTHTALWHTLFHVPYLNGDLNLIGWQDGQLMVYGIPWCGTSKICTTETHPLGGIVLLGRDPEYDHQETLEPDEKVLRTMQRMISPAWTPELLSENLNFAASVADHVPVIYYRCTKEPSAARTCKAIIDQLEVTS